MLVCLGWSSLKSREKRYDLKTGEHITYRMEWQTIDEFPNYEISITGLVRNTSNDYIKKPTLRKDGYLMVNLGHNTLRYVHRLMGDTYLENPDGKRTVNHKNGNKQDNRLENLEWMTHGENNKHAYDTGLKAGAVQKTAIPIQAMNIRTGEVREFQSQRQASIQLGLAVTSITQCKVSPDTRRAGEWQFIFSQ